MLPSQRPKFGWQGEGQQKILGRYLFFELPFQPLLALMMLAMRTIAMSAGMRDEDLFIAAVALRHHDGALRGAALLQGGQRFELAGQRILIRRQELCFKDLDDRRKQNHLTLLQSMTKPFISVLINWSALRFVVSVRWV